MSDWTFLTSHALVLSYIASTLKITARELSQAIGITERAVRKVIAELEETGYISKKREGRYIRYSVNPELPLRHHTHREIAVGDFLKSLGWKGRRRRKSGSRAHDATVAR